ncbi:tetratricopeptide repeat protein [Undibacterium sp. WLHG33]|uniref:tetratricopeptide repeat protein n=1 Tax=Undibacterium sp. WLHG33 TaxID=3412482 RepID=UPI003C2B88F8
MIKLVFVAFALSFVADSYADELSDAYKLYKNKEYKASAALFSKLADNGNAEAQEMMGELYWYGDGMAIDTNKAEQWFKKSAAQGNQKAQGFVNLIAKRNLKKSQIQYFTDQFDGGDVKFERFNCVQPSIPDVSKTNDDIKRVTNEVKSWLECYNRFVDNVNLVLPAGKAIPKDIEEIMTDEEMTKAVHLMDTTYAHISTEAKKVTDTILEKQASWKKLTESYVISNNEKVLREKEIREKDQDGNSGITREKLIDKIGSKPR